MMAYNKEGLRNLNTIKSARSWLEAGFIKKEQLEDIERAHICSFYSPNLFIRVLLFLATTIALQGVLGILALGFFQLKGFVILYGIALVIIMDFVLIRRHHHYKSGITEAIMYIGLGYIIAGVSIAIHPDKTAMLFICMLLFSFCAYRYVDMLCTMASLLSFGGLLFTVLNDAGGIAGSMIPFAFIFAFSCIYFFSFIVSKKLDNIIWKNSIVLIQIISLLFIYAGGNYLVVKELSISFMNFEVPENGDIPFAFFFYIHTVVVPIIYLYVGIKKKQMSWIRTGLIVIAFSVFTFKYYFSLGHPEITLTLAGLILIIVSVVLMRYLKIPRNGYTGERLLQRNKGFLEAEALIIAQTTGGNIIEKNSPESFGGGDFGGGGAGSNY